MAKRSKRPTPPDPDEAPSNPIEEVAVPVTVGADRDTVAAAETQNRQVGVDDSKENREVLREAAQEQGTEVEITAHRSGGQALHPLAEEAAAAKDEPKVSDATMAAMPGSLPSTTDTGLHEVTINGQVYTWRDGDEKSVPAEAIEVYKRALDANTP